VVKRLPRRRWIRPPGVYGGKNTPCLELNRARWHANSFWIWRPTGLRHAWQSRKFAGNRRLPRKRISFVTHYPLGSHFKGISVFFGPVVRGNRTSFPIFIVFRSKFLGRDSLKQVVRKRKMGRGPYFPSGHVGHGNAKRKVSREVGGGGTPFRIGDNGNQLPHG